MKIMIPTRHKGQSTIEYILLVAAVLSIVIFFLLSKNAPYPVQLNATYSAASDQASSATQQLFCALSNSVP